MCIFIVDTMNNVHYILETTATKPKENKTMTKLTNKQQKVIEALKNLEKAQIDLFNAYFDAGLVDECVDASEKAKDAYSKRVHYRYNIEQGQAKA